MIYKFNTFKSIKKRVMDPSIIFPAAYILFSAKSCPGFSSDVPIARVSSLSSETKQTNALEDLRKVEEVQGDTLGVTALLGKGTLLNLDGYPCGVFVASETKEVFILKLPSVGGWMQLIEQVQKDEPDGQANLLRLRYDTTPDPHIIKIDHALFEQLRQPLDQAADIAEPSMDKEAFWHKIEKDETWRDIEFCYGKKSISDSPISKEEGITASTEFTKELFQKFGSTNSLISSNLSIKGNVPSGTLLDFEKVGFVLVKDKCVLGKLVKDILESGSEWDTKTVEGYITCPAAMDGDILQFDSSKLQEDHTSVPLEDYNTTYCYLKNGEYGRLVRLENIKSSVKLDKEPYGVTRYYYCAPVVPLTEENTTETPPEQPVGNTINPNKLPPPPGWLLDTVDGDSKSNTESKGTNDGQPKDDPNPEILMDDQAVPNRNHTKVITTPMQYTGPNAGSVPPPPPSPPSMPSLLNTGHGNNQASGLMEQIKQGMTLKQPEQPGSNGSANGSAGFTSPMPNTNGQATPLPHLPLPCMTDQNLAPNRNALLEQIRQGTTLKKIEQPISNGSVSGSTGSVPPPPPPPPLPLSSNAQSGSNILSKNNASSPSTSCGSNGFLDELQKSCKNTTASREEAIKKMEEKQASSSSTGFGDKKFLDELQKSCKNTTASREEAIKKMEEERKKHKKLLKLSPEMRALTEQLAKRKTDIGDDSDNESNSDNESDWDDEDDEI